MNNQLAIAVGLLAGLLLGVVAEFWQIPWLLGFAEGVSPIGSMFMNLVRMVVIPLVMATLFSGVASLPDPKQLGKLGGITVAFFWTTTIIGILFGMAVMAGALSMFPVASQLPGTGGTTELPTILDFFIGLIPANPFEAAANGALLQLVIFTLLFAAAAGTLPDAHRKPLVELSDSITAVLIKLVHWVLWTAPLGVFALAAPMAARAGADMLADLAVFVIAVALALVFFTLTVYVPAAMWLGKKSPMLFLKACGGPQIIGFSTTSSAATLPVMLEVAVKELGVSKVTAGMVLSVGASINRAGSSLFQGGAVVFLAALYGVPLTAATVIGVVIALFFTSLTVAAVPSASVVTLAPALDAAGVPLAGMSVILGIDRIPDMIRTAVNVTGHLTAATIVERAAARDAEATPTS
jgi:Na+/H+-dicarboxylate symporter